MSEHGRPALGAELRRRTVVLDGGLSTQLELAGNDLSSQLWSARLLAQEPAEITAAHAAFFAVGAEVSITSSYQASADGFATLGIDAAGTERLLGLSADLAARARDEAEAGDGRPRWVAASVGPYGAVLGDGSEYRGDYGWTVAQLREWHRPRLQTLMQLVADGRADVLAVETIPSSAEAEAILAELDGTGIPVWISFTVADGRTRTSEPIAEALALADGIDEVIAVGVNCCEPDQVDAVSAPIGVPLLVYPNTGETWDGQRRGWTGTAATLADRVPDWVGKGIAGIGGCCRVDAAAIGEMTARVPRPY